MEGKIEAAFEGLTSSLLLGVERYQFPEILDDEWDSNWLIVTGRVELDGRRWQFRDPCLTTFEVQRLAKWLDDVAAGTAKRAFCGFTEPNLDFEQISNQVIRIGFSLEALPPWVARGGDFGEVGFNVPIDRHLESAASSLRSVLTQFPVRGLNPDNIS